MDILFVAHGPNQFNGPNVWLTRLLPRLKRMGLQPRVLFIMNNNNPCALLQTLLNEGIDCAVMRRQHTEGMVLEILKLVKQNRPDIFVPNLSVGAFFAASWLREAGIPTVGVIRSDDNFHRDLADEFVFGVERFRLSGAVCVSDYLYHKLAHSGECKTKLLKCPSGAPIPDSTASFQRPLTIVYTGRLVEKQKRIFSVVEAMKQVVHAVPGTKAIIYGDGAQKQEVLAAIEAANMPDHFNYGGILLPHQIQPTIASAQVLLLLSDYEGLSTSLMEGMACGLVPIVKDMRSGLTDVIEHGKNGYVVKDESDVVHAVRLLTDDKTIWEEMSQRGRESIERYFSSDIAAEKWKNFLTQLMEESGPSREIQIPHIEQLNLPPVRSSPDGMAREDVRLLPTKAPSPNVKLEGSASEIKVMANKEKIDKEYLQPELCEKFMDLYLVRQSILNAVKTVLPELKGTLLDIGCGIMPYRELMTSAPSRVTKYIGLDIETETYQAPVDLRWDGRTIPLGDRSVDCAVATEVLEHCPDPLAVLKEARRVLTPGGFLFFTVPFLWPLHDVPYDYYRYTPYSITKLCEEAGFSHLNLNALGGWNASLAQMIGLWVKRSPMSNEERELRTKEFFPLYKILLESDTPVDPFSTSPMATGWWGVVRV